jgi:uncharacterized OsmC-like protein
MDGAELRALQAPLKTRYREAPETALVPAQAEATLDFANVACEVTAGGRAVTAGLHPAAGGDGTRACSADMLLAALAACAGVTLTAVASAMGLAVRGGRIVAVGTWDARGTLGVDRSVPVGLAEISLTFELDTEAEPAALERLVATTERYCVILQTLRAPPRVSVVSKRTN